MIQELQKTAIEHYQHVSILSGLSLIKSNKINIAIHERKENSELKAFTSQLLQTGFNPLRTTLNITDFDVVFDEHFATHQSTATSGFQLLKQDIKSLITQFSEICNTPNLRLFFGLIDTDMCKRFHVDMYELRMLCTYEGQGTLWLTDDNNNHTALKDHNSNDQIAWREGDIQQLNANDVAIIKGALYPNSAIGGLVHKSPAIEHLNQKRIMLRVDSNALFDNI